MSLLYKAQTRFLFHAHIKIKISVFYEDRLFDVLFGILEEIDRKYNSYQPGSYIDRINKHAGHFVEVDGETIRLLRRVISLSDCLDGDFDPTIMPLIRLWGFYRENQRTVPSREEIGRVKPLINYKNIIIEGNRVRIGEGQEIITGSFIKAYAVDCLTDRMEKLGINDAIINAGGSTIRAINNEGHPFWEIIVREPVDDSILFRLNIGNQCYSTSSQAKTFVEIGGRRYGHILDPKSGYSSANKEVGIVSEDCLMGDILSTGLYNQTAGGFLEKMEFLSSFYPIEGFMIDENDNKVFTKGFNQYIKGEK